MKMDGNTKDPIPGEDQFQIVSWSVCACQNNTQHCFPHTASVSFFYFGSDTSSTDTVSGCESLTEASLLSESTKTFH